MKRAGAHVHRIRLLLVVLLLRQRVQRLPLLRLLPFLLLCRLLAHHLVCRLLQAVLKVHDAEGRALDGAGAEGKADVCRHL